MYSALWAGLAACGATTTTTHIGGPCDASSKCDDGQVCDRTATGGAVCIEASGDVDNDGIPNGKDFCEHLAGGANDEDGDGFGDECDACPIAAPGQADGDGDAVAAPCDPDTRTPGDRILMFNGFNAAINNAGANWKFQNGEAVVTAGDAGDYLVLPLAATSNHITIFTGYQIDASSTTAATAAVAVGSRTVLPLGNSEIRCGASRASGTDQVLLFQTDASMSQTQNSLTLGTAFNPTTKYRVVQQIDGGTTRCAVAGASMAESGAIQLSTDGTTPTTAVLYARGATVRFSYILVVGQ